MWVYQFSRHLAITGLSAIGLKSLASVACLDLASRMISAVFQNLGTVTLFSELVNNVHSSWARQSANVFNSLAGRRSGPLLLLTSSDKGYYTPCQQKTYSDYDQKLVSQE